MNINVAVVILAGGRGSRIGGTKPLRELGGERLIDRALRLARSWSDIVAIAVRDRAQAPAVNAAIIVDDAIEGPLGGLAAGLRFARSAGRELLLTIPADMPFLPSDLLERLAAALGRNSCALASSGGHIHPVCGLWRVKVHNRIDSYAASGRRSLHGFAELAARSVVEWPHGEADPFFNINSADELAEAERRLR